VPPILSPPAAPMWWAPPYLYPRHLSPRPAVHYNTLADHPSSQGDNGGSHAGMANSGNRATPLSKQTVVATAPRPRATRRMETDGAAICSSSMSASSFRKQSGSRAAGGLVTSPPLPRGRTTRARTPVRRWRARTRASR
jgi:hypothetical protein